MIYSKASSPRKALKASNLCRALVLVGLFTVDPTLAQEDNEALQEQQSQARFEIERQAAESRRAQRYSQATTNATNAANATNALSDTSAASASINAANASTTTDAASVEVETISTDDAALSDKAWSSDESMAKAKSEHRLVTPLGVPDPQKLDSQGNYDSAIPNKPSLLQRFFGTHITHKERVPSSVADLIGYNNAFFYPVILSSVGKVTLLEASENQGEHDQVMTIEVSDLSEGVDESLSKEALYKQAEQNVKRMLGAAPVKVTDEHLVPYDDQQSTIAYEMGLGLNYVGYLLHMYVPLTKEYTVPFVFVKDELIDQVAKAAHEAMKPKEQNYANLSSATTTQDGNTAALSSLTPFAHAQLKDLWGDNLHVSTLFKLGLSMDLSYLNGDCVGMTMLEADLKAKCPANQPLDGMVVMTMPKEEIANEGIFTELHRQLTANVLMYNAFAQGVELGTRLSGFSSSLNVGYNAFELPLRTFDRHLYSANSMASLGEIAVPFLTANALSGEELQHLSLEQVSPKCSLLNQDSCGWYFVGKNTNDLLHIGNNESYFNLQQKLPSDLNLVASQQAQAESEGELSGAEQMAKDFELFGYSSDNVLSHTNLFGIPVRFNWAGQPVLGLRNTLLSGSDYKNYSFLTEAEMRVLMDLGYRIEYREFFGNSIYSFGTPQQRITRSVNEDFAYYDHANETYQAKFPSIMPWTIGVHVYGSYNDIVHSSNIFSKGVGAMGVRVDGSENYYYQTPASSIITSGEKSVGIAFTYGRDNSAYISGHVSAMDSKSAGIRIDMGSNINSDMVEYRGSYSRARTVDYLNGKLSRDEAASLPLLDELQGPQVRELTIDGLVEGAAGGILIDESSFVKEINLSSNASVKGGILSSWNPFANGKGDIILRHDGKKTDLLDAKVQVERSKDLTTTEFIEQELTTAVNLGVKLDNEHHLVRTRGFNPLSPSAQNESPVEVESEELKPNDSRAAVDANATYQLAKSPVLREISWGDRIKSWGNVISLAYADRFDINDLLHTAFEEPVGRIVGDPKSRVTLRGDISGSRIDVHNYGGRTLIEGNVRAHRVYVHQGILSLYGLDGAINQLNLMRVNSGAVLDLVNGKSSHTYIQGLVRLGHGATIRVDVDSQGKVLDNFSILGELRAADYQLNLEPGVSYDDMRSLGADPKALFNFVTSFVQSANQRFAKYDVSIRIPKYIWDSTGNYGRELRCSARGCRVGGFVSNAAYLSSDALPAWRYYLSFGGMAAFILGFYAWYLYKRIRKIKSEA